MSAPPAKPRRRYLSQTIQIGQTYQRRRDGARFEIQQIYRSDRQALVKSESGIVTTVGFSELSRKWRQVPER